MVHTNGTVIASVTEVFSGSGGDGGANSEPPRPMVSGSLRRLCASEPRMTLRFDLRFGNAAAVRRCTFWCNH